MGLAFRPANRTQAKPLIGLYAESGAGKTLSALLLARGFAGQGRIGMIETESGRGEAYADDARLAPGYEVLPIRGSFGPMVYGDAIEEAEAAKLEALIIDSASHEWEGSGGVLDMAAERQAKGMKGVIVWQQPKILHQRHFMLKLLATPIPLIIVCMRAKYPMRELKKPDGTKEWVRSETLEPKQADDILFEMFCHAWIDQQHKAHVTKWTRDDLREVIIDGEAISLETGRRLRSWADGSLSYATDDRSSTPVRDWASFNKAFIERIAKVSKSAEVDRIVAANEAALQTYRTAAPQAWEELMAFVARFKTEFQNAEDA